MKNISTSVILSVYVAARRAGRLQLVDSANNAHRVQGRVARGSY